MLGLVAPAERFRRAAHAGIRDLGTLGRALLWSGALHAIPRGLGAFAGEDVRARLRRWWDQANGAASPEPGDDGSLADLLPGLEWSEMSLVVNSFEHATLMRLCRPDRAETQRGSDS
jgi:hypothetical protein